jgi:hypothetical protein
MGGAGGQCAGDGSGSGADLGHRVSGEIAQRGGDALDGLRIDKEVLSELGLGRHLLF